MRSHKSRQTRLAQQFISEYLEFIYPSELAIQETSETINFSFTWIYTSKSTMESSVLGFMINGMTSTFQKLISRL